MTTFTAISATETQSGKPITESLMTRLANNCLAIQEGDPTAPRVQKEAFDVGELFVAESAYGFGNLSFTFNHGDTGFHQVFVQFSANFYKTNGSASFTLSVGGATVSSGAIKDTVGDWSVAGGRSVSVGSGNSTISISFTGVNSFDSCYLSAVAYKR